MKETTALILGIILGLVMVLGGLYMILSPNVDCGGQTMSPRAVARSGIKWRSGSTEGSRRQRE